MNIPQVKSMLGHIAMIAGGATGSALLAAIINGQIKSFSMLIDGMEQFAWVGFVAALTQIVGWLGQSSPLKPDLTVEQRVTGKE